MYPLLISISFQLRSYFLLFSGQIIQIFYWDGAIYGIYGDEEQ